MRYRHRRQWWVRCGACIPSTSPFSLFLFTSSFTCQPISLIMPALVINYSFTQNRDLRSFEIRFEFESDVPIRFDSIVTGRFENFESPRLPRLPSYSTTLTVQRQISIVSALLLGFILSYNLACSRAASLVRLQSNKTPIWQSTKI